MKRLLLKFREGDGIKIFQNAGWLYLDQVVRLLVGIVVFSLVVRSLGAEKYGVLSYALAFPGVFMPLALLGLDYVIVRDFVRHPEERDMIFGTAFSVKAVAGVIAFCIALIAVLLVPADAPDRSLLVVTSATLLFQPILTIDTYFQSQVASKYSSLARIATSLLASGMRAGLALNHAPVKWFVWLIIVEAVIYGACLLAARKASGIAWFNPWQRFDRRIMNRLLSAAWPLFLADIAMTGYLKVDQLLLSHFAGVGELGKYAAAFRLADNAEFFALALIHSYFPKIIQTHHEHPEMLEDNVRRFFNRMTWFVIIVAALLSVAAPLISRVVFGARFGHIWPVLVVLGWANVFATQIAVRGKWFLVEGLQTYSLAFFVLGAAFHLTLLPYMVTTWGALGAATSFCLAQAFMSVVAPVLFKRSRPATLLALRSFWPSGI